MARSVTAQRKILSTAISWTIAIIIFFPIFWILVLSFKTEGDAIRTPIEVLTSTWTLESYSIVQERSDYFNQRNADQMEAVDHDMMRENSHSSMTINKPDRQTRVTFGGPQK